MFRIPYIRFLARKWRHPKVLVSLFVFELAGTVAALTLFGIADPDLFRTALWQVGSDNGFNSSPKQILYAYANYRPIPKTPFVWSQTLTSYNVAISVLCTFILLVKAVMFVMHIWYPILSVPVNLVLTVLWIVSFAGQAGPDHSDPEHPSSVAWYINKSCDYAIPSGNKHYCLMAKGTFAITVVMAFVFLLNLLFGIWSMIPTPEERATQKLESDDLQLGAASASKPSAGRHGEMKSIPEVSAVPYTPRTLAFNTLDRQLPLRSQNEQWA